MIRFLGRTKKTALLMNISEVSGRFILWLSMLIIIRWTQFFYPMQLVTPSVVAIAVRMLMAI